MRAAYEKGTGEFAVPALGLTHGTMAQLKDRIPSVRAALTMLPGKIRYPNRSRYMPHIVLGDPSQREAIIGPNNTCTERYLGVWITDTPDELIPRRSVAVTLTLMYWPEEQYEGVAPEAMFTLREGPVVVGFGSILSRIESINS